MRISRHQMFMDIARVVAKRSTCPRLNVGAVIVIRNRVVSMGYNGSPPGEPHCDEVGCLMEGLSCIRTIHAEANALDYVPYGLAKDKKKLYITDSPCADCVGLILKDGHITHVYYGQAYRDRAPIITLWNHNIQALRITPSGCIIDDRDGRIIDET